jgi:excisionase family DNA binding protein
MRLSDEIVQIVQNVQFVHTSVQKPGRTASRRPRRIHTATLNMPMRSNRGQIIAAAESFSTADVADALGVSVSTVKRWVDEGILPAHRTAGGHRRLRGDEVVSAVRAQLLPHRNLTALGRLMRPTPVGGLNRQLIRALHHGDGTRVRELIRAAHDSGMSFASMADDVVAPVMAEIGDAWESRRLDVFEEHRATQLCQAALYELKTQIPAAQAGRRPLALGGGPEGDPYVIANLMAELVLLEAGWKVMNFGPNTPMTSFQLAADRLRPRLVWLSVSYLPDFSAFQRGCTALCVAVSAARTTVVAGGRMMTPERRAKLPLIRFGDNLTDLQHIAASLA